VILVIHDCFQDWYGQLSVNLSSALPVENKKKIVKLYYLESGGCVLSLKNNRKRI
jgi:hypothetical protein